MWSCGCWLGGKVPLVRRTAVAWGGRAVCSAGGCRGCQAAVYFARCPAEPGGCNRLLSVQTRCREAWSWASLASSQRPEFQSDFFPANSKTPEDLTLPPTEWSVEYSARCWTKFSSQQHQVLATAAWSRKGQLAAAGIMQMCWCSTATGAPARALPAAGEAGMRAVFAQYNLLTAPAVLAPVWRRWRPLAEVPQLY